jgi:Uma2 family endonuclease
MTPVPTRHRFTVDEFHRMATAGIFGEDDRVELIDGEIVDMTPIGSRHQACIDRLTELFVGSLAGKALVRVQGPLRLGEHSEPQPDVTLLRRQPDFYASGHPGPGDVLLVVDVADTSLPYDRGVKMPLYARAGIPEAWLVDLEGERIVVYRAPGEAGYGQVAEVRGAERLSPQAFPDVTVAAEQVLG